MKSDPEDSPIYRAGHAARLAGKDTLVHYQAQAEAARFYAAAMALLEQAKTIRSALQQHRRTAA